MASIERRLVHNEPRYDVRYRDPSGRQRKKTFTKKGNAIRFAAIVEADKVCGIYLDPKAGRIAFQKYADEWLRTNPLETSSRETIERRLRVHAYPALGQLSLHQITPSVIRGWLRELKLPSSNSRRSVFTNVATVLTAAVDDALIPTNPCRAGSVRPPALERRRITPWDMTMVFAVPEALPERYKLAIDLGGRALAYAKERSSASPLPTSIGTAASCTSADRSSCSAIAGSPSALPRTAALGSSRCPPRSAT